MLVLAHLEGSLGVRECSLCVNGQQMVRIARGEQDAFFVAAAIVELLRHSDIKLSRYILTHLPERWFCEQFDLYSAL